MRRWRFAARFRAAAGTIAVCGAAAVCVVAAGGASASHAAAPTPQRSSAQPRIAVYPLIRYVSRGLDRVPVNGYTPGQIRAAYSVNPLFRAGINGRRQSIVIVDSFGSPTIRHDLAVFDRAFHLPGPASLLILHPAGRIPRFNSSMSTWAGETTLDVEWAHVMAPRARIVLVETPVSENEGTSGFPQIVTAEKYVIAHHLGGVISQSFGATEQTFPSRRALIALRGAYLAAARRSANVTVLSASGDEGATDYELNMANYYPYRVTSWPASDPLVTSVGGTSLRLSRTGNRIRPDRVWNEFGGASGGGRSVFLPRPAFQNGDARVTGSHRGVPDISMSAACDWPVDVYSSYPGGGAGWGTACGTSEATPLLAGVIALADQAAGHPIGPINSYLYRLAAAKDRGIVDIVAGNNTVTIQLRGKSVTVRGWPAVRGYDLSSGVGTINAHWFVLELAALANRKAPPPQPWRPLLGGTAPGYSLWYRSGITPTSWVSLTRSAR